MTFPAQCVALVWTLGTFLLIDQTRHSLHHPDYLENLIVDMGVGVFVTLSVHIVTTFWHPLHPYLLIPL